ncbi:unnamed protein product [Lymnaea stagnalis]|uniref:Receptor expression-enhancing protein n=1 Tax=Lymnaea stagnalis TaxID=6523 RepID=A0AAV2H3G8_LYMST
MVSAILSRLVILVFGTLYPAYASYKAVRTKNVKEYVKWMMYWIVFALFCSVETFSDVFLSWLPFYYELKIVFVLWMLSPMTQGSSFLFKKFVHPQLARREKDIDEMIEQASKQGYSTLLTLGTKGLQAVMKTAIMGQSKLVDHLRRSYSTSDLSNDGQNLITRHEALDNQEEDGDDELDNRLLEDNAELERRSRNPLGKSKSSTLSLSSVKEEEGEDGEHVITETFALPSTARRHYSMKEESISPAYRKLRSQSLPPSTLVTKPSLGPKVNPKLISVKSQEMNVKDKSQTVEVSNTANIKHKLLSRSLSQDSGLKPHFSPTQSQMSLKNKNKLLGRSQSEERATSLRSDILSLSPYGATVEAKRFHLSTALPEGEEIKKPAAVAQVKHEPYISLEIKVPESDSKTQMMMEKNNFERSSDHMAVAVKEIEEPIAIWRSLPRFLSDLPVIEEFTPLESSPISQSSEKESKSPVSSVLSQVIEVDVGESKVNIFNTANEGSEQDDLIYIDAVESHLASEPKPASLDPHSDLLIKGDESKPSRIWKTNVDEKDDSDKTNKSEDIRHQSFELSDIEPRSSSLEVFDDDFDSCSEWSDGGNWETLSELSSLDSPGYQKSDSTSEGILNFDNAKGTYGPWSAPNSPATCIRESKHCTDESHSRSTPIISSSTKNQYRDEFTQIMARLRREVAPTSFAARDYYLPSSSNLSVSEISSPIHVVNRGDESKFDPFKIWQPQYGAGSSSQAASKSPSTTQPGTRGSRRDRSYVRATSMDTGGGEAMYFTGTGHKVHPFSPSTLSRPRSRSLSSDTSDVVFRSYSPKIQLSNFHQNKE